MDWITSINRALRHVEEHIQDESLSVESVAAVTAYSPFYLQRLFYILTDMSLSEYIRGRRLSMAGQELQATGARVLDTALRYGYETPESFSKAFRRFHGVTPSAAQRTRVQLRYLNPLQLKLELTGGTIMDYTLENMGPLTLVGLTRQFDNETAFTDIPKFWDEFNATHTGDQCMSMLGVCFDKPGSPVFDYMIGAFYQAGNAVPEGFETRTIEPHQWVRFRCVGALPQSLQKVNRQIFTEWLPNNSEYEMADGINIEMYTEGDIHAPDYVSEIWIPIRNKE